MIINDLLMVILIKNIFFEIILYKTNDPLNYSIKLLSSITTSENFQIIILIIICIVFYKCIL